MSGSDCSTAKRDAAIVGLLKETTIRAAARHANIGEATLRRWLREDEEFKAEYSAVRAEVLAQALNQLRMGALEAVVALRSIVASEDAPPRVRVSASRAILGSLLRGVQIEKTAQRICGQVERVTVVRFDEEDEQR